MMARVSSNPWPDALVMALKRLPDDAYGSVRELWVALGGEDSEGEQAWNSVKHPLKL